MEFLGLVKAKKNGDIYASHGGGKFSNLSKGGKGKLSDEDAKKLFVIPITLNKMAEKNPLIIQLIERCGLSAEPYTEKEKNNFIENAMKSLKNQKV